MDSATEERLSAAYDALELEFGVNFVEIKDSYRDLVQVWHPDKYQGASSRLKNRAEEKLKELNNAYSLLKAYFDSYSCPPSKGNSGRHPNEQEASRHKERSEAWQIGSVGMYQENLALTRFRSSRGTTAYGFVDRHRSVIIPPRFAGAAGFSNGLAAIRPVGSHLWGYIEKTGRVAIPVQFEYADSFLNDFQPTANVSIGGSTWRISKSGGRA